VITAVVIAGLAVVALFVTLPTIVLDAISGS
jgi:hypothetical protein